MNKNDCIALINTKGINNKYSIIKLGGLYRLRLPDNTTIPVNTWDKIYQYIATLPDNPGIINPAGLTDEQIAALGRG